MSANRHSICRVCGGSELQELEKEGVIVVFDDNYAYRYDEESELPLEMRTLREDYEVYIEDDHVVLSYAASCSRCGFSASYVGNVLCLK